MYGLAENDPVVRYYDIAFTAGSESDIPWFAGRAAASGGPVLDLACGTGRVALELARRGIDVTAVDQSVGMLSIFRTKLSSVPTDVANRIAVHEMPMTQFGFPTKYRAIICCDAFFHNMTVADERRCLQLVADHLAPEGVFLFNLNNPNPKFLSWASSPDAAAFQKRGEYAIPGTSDLLTVEHSTRADLNDQTVFTRLRFIRRRADGALVEESESEWGSRFLYRYEAEHLLELCGLRVLSIVGTYEDGPVTPETQLVFTVGPAAPV